MDRRTAFEKKIEELRETQGTSASQVYARALDTLQLLKKQGLLEGVDWRDEDRLIRQLAARYRREPISRGVTV